MSALKIRHGLLSLALATMLPATSAAQLRLSRLIADKMVMQRDIAVPVWGWGAAPGAEVVVTFDGARHAGRADATGAWKVTLPAMRAGGPHAMTVASGDVRIPVRDILVGDVWLCSGQSNMEWTVANARDGAREIAAANDTRIRHFKVPTSWAERPEDDLAGGDWQVADPAHVGDFTAVGYFFARELRKTVDVPIGLLHSSWGGSRIEPWMSRDALKMDERGWAELMRREREHQQGQLDSLRARIGGLPTQDAGFVDGRAPWADPALDDGAWRAIEVPKLWEAQG